jgi:acyl-CoA thioesterase FadM
LLASEPEASGFFQPCALAGIILNGHVIICFYEYPALPRLTHLLSAVFPPGRSAGIPNLSGRKEDDHVTNVEIAWILDRDRMAFARDFGWWPLVSGGYTGLLVATQIEYIAELWTDRPVQVTTAIETLGRTSYTLVQAIEQDGWIAALARSTFVLRGPQGIEVLSDALREQMKTGMIQPSSAA